MALQVVKHTDETNLTGDLVVLSAVVATDEVADDEVCFTGRPNNELDDDAAPFGIKPTCGLVRRAERPRDVAGSPTLRPSGYETAEHLEIDSRQGVRISRDGA